VNPETIEESKWDETLPVDLSKYGGKCVITRMQDVYNNGASSDYRYSIGFIGMDGANAVDEYYISLDNDYASIPVKEIVDTSNI
jgi:hypothetical protein